MLERFFSCSELKKAFQAYDWDGNDAATTLRRRGKLQSELVAAIASNNDDNVLRAVVKVYDWGFPGWGLPDCYTEGTGKRLTLKLLRAWTSIDGISDIGALKTLTELLDVHDAGPATVTKLLCFLNQKRYAIYDARVSLALSRVVDGNGDRLFPILPRQGNVVRRDVRPTAIMSRYYARYVYEVRQLATRFDMPLVHIEMSLFQIGGPISTRTGRLVRTSSDWPGDVAPHGGAS